MCSCWVVRSEPSRVCPGGSPIVLVLYPQSSKEKMALGPNLEVIPGTRILVENFGLIGSKFPDLEEGNRRWTVINVLNTVVTKPNRGVRCRVIDQVGITSFIEHADLDLLVGRAKPGEFCPWTGEHYPEIGDEHAGWRGLYMEEPDLEDDLHIRELELRQELGWGILPELQLTRYLHLGENRDVERLEMLLMDFDPETGMGPDPGISTICRRWTNVQQEAVEWTEVT